MVLDGNEGTCWSLWPSDLNSFTTLLIVFTYLYLFYVAVFTEVREDSLKYSFPCDGWYTNSYVLSLAMFHTVSVLNKHIVPCPVAALLLGVVPEGSSIPTDLIQVLSIFNCSGRAGLFFRIRNRRIPPPLFNVYKTRWGCTWRELDAQGGKI